MSYNGWKNYETWSVALILDNEEGSQRYWREATQEAWDEAKEDPVLSREQRARYELAKRLEDEIKEAQPELDCLSSQLLGRALSKVEWDDIAYNWLAEVEKEEAAQ